METPRAAGRRTRRSASFIGALTLGGRVLERAGAFGQILLIAAFFGATTQADLYFIASIVPLTFGAILGEALYASVLPSLARHDDSDLDGIASAGFWISVTLVLLTTVAYLCVVVVVVPIAAPAGSKGLGPWLAFAPIGIFVALGAYLSALLLRLEHYTWPPFRSAASTIVGLGLSGLALALTDSLVWVALAVSTGFGVAFALLVGEVVRGAGLGPLGLPSRAAVREVAGLRGRFVTSVAGGVLGGQVFVFLERALAASLGVGAVAAISYARGVAFTPGIVAQSISLGLYPGMLRAHAVRDVRSLRTSFLAGLRATLFVGVCTGAYVALYSESVSGLVFGHGSLSATSLVEVSRTLAAFALAIVGSMLMILTARVFGAIDRFHGIVLSQSVALALYVPLAVLLRPLLGPSGLALAFGVAEVAGGLFGVVQCARRLEARLPSIARTVGLPVAVRAAPVVVGLAVFHYAIAPGSDAAEALGGLALGTLLGVAVLWWSSWPEVEAMRRFAQRVMPF